MIKKLEWDSDYFGINIAELDAKNLNKNLTEVVYFVKSEKISIVQSCCDVSDLESIKILENNGFNFVDLKITYVLSLADIETDEDDFELATDDDIPSLKKIAANAFIDKSRYYHNFFDKQKADNLFEIWVEKAVQGNFDDMCLKVDDNGESIGFITGKEMGEDARIGIIGIDNTSHNKGIGSSLLRNFFSFYKLKNKKNIIVSTQGKNIIANNFYIKNGFKIKNIEAWFYKKYIT